VTGAYPVLHVGSFGSAGRGRSARPWARTFRGLPASVPEARRFVAGLLAGCPAREVLTTCVSELATNAIVHTASGQGGVFTVEVDLPRPGVARVAVTDEGGPSLPSPGRLAPIADRGLMAEGGRGLALVAAYTSRWGYTDAHPARTVWAEASWPVPAPIPAPAPAPAPAPGREPSRRSRRFFPRPPADPSGPAA
jgi:anti-sigma regulatory factor (Ser/Thr protein kinase)